MDIKAAHPCSYKRAAWVQFLSSPRNEVCILSVDEMKLRLSFFFWISIHSDVQIYPNS